MNNRLSIPEIAGLLVEYTGRDKKSAERFLKEFVAVVRENIFEDRLVKVRGLGTFKIIEVEQRESIDVNTGGRIVIPAHYKFSFLPDKDLKEQVNKPFSMFETIEINEHVDLKQFADIDQQVVTAPVEEVVAEPEPVMDIHEPEVEAETETPISEPVIEVITEENTPVINESIEITEEEPVIAEEEEVIQPETIVEAIPEPETVVVPEIEDEPVKPAQSTPVWKKLAAVASVVFVLAAGTVFFINRQSILADIPVEELLQMGDAAVDHAFYQMYPDAVETPEDTDDQKADTVETVQPVETPEEPSNPIPSINETQAEVIARVKIEPGSRLTLIALEYYQEKVFWVYLYEYNKKSIKDPNNIPVGTEILVPAPRIYNIDSKNQESINKAANLQTTILRGLQN